MIKNFQGSLRCVGRRLACVVTVFVMMAAGSSGVSAQHVDIAVYQNADGRITTHNSTDGGQPELRVFERAFDFFGHLFGNPALPKAFSGDDPGFLFDGADAPSGYQGLPAGATLSMNLLPFRVPGFDTGNLFYWDGVGTTVDFGLVPAGHTLTVTEAGGARQGVLDGSAMRQDGLIVGVTDSGGGMHEYLQFRLDDSDGNVATDPSRGFYLFGLELTMPGLQASAPIFVALSSPEIPAAVEDDVVAWMQANLDFFLPETSPGDFNADGNFDCQDINALTAAIAGGMNDPSFDLSGDGQLDLADRDAWLAAAGAANLNSGASYLLGDANLDGVVDVSDFNAWNGNKFQPLAAWCGGDFNVDGAVDVSDFNIWNGNKFSSADGVSQVVPEPAGCGLWLACGMLAFIAGRRRGAAP